MAEQASRHMDKGSDSSNRGSDFTSTTGQGSGGSPGSGMSTSSVIEQAGSVARDLGEQASAASDALYQQGARAGDYVSRNVNEYPLPALLVAGAVGYGLAYLIHTQWQNWGWQLGGWWDSEQRGGRRNERHPRHAQHERRS